MTRDDLLQSLGDANVAAFLRVIREGESSQDDSAYTIRFGGSHFSGWQHPKESLTVGRYTSSAAGAYQFLWTTWNWLTQTYGFEDFSPANQDCGAVALIHRRGALEAVKQGNLDEAIRLCNREWASLPGSPYGQPVQTVEHAREVFARYGGQIGSPVSGTPDPSPVEEVNQTQEVIMAPIVLPILSALSTVIPALGQLFATSEVAQRNVAAGKLVAEKLVEVTGAVNLQEAAEKIQSDASVKQAATDAMNLLIPQLTESGGGGIAAARQAAQQADGDWKKVVFTFPFMLCVFLLPLIYAVVLSALIKAPWLVEFTNDARMLVIGAVINLALAAIISYVYGQSLQQQRRASEQK